MSDDDVEAHDMSDVLSSENWWISWLFEDMSNASEDGFKSMDEFLKRSLVKFKAEPKTD